MRTCRHTYLPKVSITVVFVSRPPIEIHIKKRMNPASNDSNTFNQSFPKEEPKPDAAISKSAATDIFIGSSRSTRQKVAVSQLESNLFDASLRALNHRKAGENTMPELRLVEFSLKMPVAKSVQLAADFTDWEESPIDLIRFGDGVWSTTVPLPPGNYAYRFLVDGHWHDDTHTARHNLSSSGTAKDFIKVK